MSKRQKKLDDPKQMSLFELVEQTKPAAHKPTAGALACAVRLRDAIRSAIKTSPLGIHQIAGEMSHLVDETITADQIYSWTKNTDSDGRPGRHIPAQYLPAFCRVTGSPEAIAIMGELVGLFVLPGPDALRSEIAKLDETIDAARAEKRKRQLLLKEIERR